MAEIQQTVDVALVGEEMNHIQGVLDVHDLVDRAVTAADETSKLLRYFDSCGTLILNAKQMDDFLAEWDAARRLVTSSQDERAWEEVRALALRVAKSNTEFLAFSGD